MPDAGGASCVIARVTTLVESSTGTILPRLQMSYVRGAFKINKVDRRDWIAE